MLVSNDTGERVDADSPSALGVDILPLLARLVKHFDARGLTLTTRSDSPVGAGIAGSSALNIAVVSALAAFTGRAMTDEERLELAKNVEAQVINVPTGVQDYRPALYGGVSAVELSVTGVRRVPLAIDPEALTARVVLAYTGASRNSGINNWDMMKRHIDGEPAVVAAFDKIAIIAREMRGTLERGDWAATGDSARCRVGEPQAAGARRNHSRDRRPVGSRETRRRLRGQSMRSRRRRLPVLPDPAGSTCRGLGGARRRGRPAAAVRGRGRRRDT